MEKDSVDTLELYSLMETSPTLAHLPGLARQMGYDVEITEEDVAPGLDLPSTWDEYLAGLSKKDRHELRRKFRRLESVEGWRWYCLYDAGQVVTKLDDFLELMRQSDPEKLEYMTPEREQFFRRITQLTAELGIIKLFFLEIDQKPVAASLCFDYGSSRLLYNSGYNPEYSYYSVGLLLNALCLRDAIEQGQDYFDFLRGPEPYKYHLGGKNHTLYQMVVKRS
jgi:CelD/BcsL family acetyltransferase involved in cellulose biosynthesis